MGEVRVAGVFALTILAFLIVFNYLIRGFAANHADSAWAQGLATVI